MEIFVVSVIVIFFIGLAIVFKDAMSHGPNKV